MKRIDALPDDVLLEIFVSYMDESLSYEGKTWIESWQSLLHVCRRWRTVVLGSPRRLNLQLYCTPKTPVRDALNIWPALPLLVRGSMTSSSTDNIVAALGESKRVSQVILEGLARKQLEEVLASMQVSFPEMTDLQLWSDDDRPPAIPDSFLDGSAPRLRIFRLDGIPFPGLVLSKLLLSATHLAHLMLTNIPHSGYISPEAVVVPISMLPGLEVLSLEFQSPRSRPDLDSRSLSPPKRSTLPALDVFDFIGVTEYLEELVTRIDAPKLNTMNISFFNQIDFDCRRLAQFINRTPTLKALDEAQVEFIDSVASVIFRYQTSESGHGELQLNIFCNEPDWQLSSIEQVCNSLRPLSTVEDLYIEHEYSELVWKNDAIENTLWLQLLLPFTAVKNLYLSKEFAPGVAAALKELVGGITEVLSSLQNIFVEGLESSGPFQKNIEQFVAARKLADHPIVISDWDKGSDTESM